MLSWRFSGPEGKSAGSKGSSGTAVSSLSLYLDLKVGGLVVLVVLRLQ